MKGNTINGGRTPEIDIIKETHTKRVPQAENCVPKAAYTQNACRRPKTACRRPLTHKKRVPQPENCVPKAAFTQKACRRPKTAYRRPRTLKKRVP